MITNLIQVAAFQKLAFQLMLGEADRIAQELRLPLPLPIARQHVVDAFVALPQLGIGGSIQLSNVAFTFSEGRLHTITRIDIYPPLNIAPDTIARMPPTSKLAAEGAYQLATQWLHAISVNVAALEEQFPPKISHQNYRAGESDPHGTKNRAPKEREPIRKTVTMFEIAWDDGKRKEFERPPVTVRLLGNTKELMDLQLADRRYLRRPLIVMTNATELGLGMNPPPLVRIGTPTNRTATPGPWRYPHFAPPRNLPEEQLPDWMAKFFGGEAVAQTLTQPEKVNAYLLKKYDPILEKRGVMNSIMKDFKKAADYPVRRGPVPVKLDLAEQLGAIILDAFSYDWAWRRNYEDPKYHRNGVRYGLRLEYVRQTNVVDLVFASDNSALIFYGPSRRTPEMSFEPKKQTVLKLLQGISR